MINERPRRFGRVALPPMIWMNGEHDRPVRADTAGADHLVVQYNCHTKPKLRQIDRPRNDFRGRVFGSRHGGGHHHRRDLRMAHQGGKGCQVIKGQGLQPKSRCRQIQRIVQRPFKLCHHKIAAVHRRTARP